MKPMIGVALAAMMAAGPALAQATTTYQRSETYSTDSDGSRHVWRSETTTREAPPPPPQTDQVITTHKTVIRNYYQNAYQDRCPPGYAQQGSNCVAQPVAHAFVRGQPLPAGTVYYDLPQPLEVRLGAPPPGYRYVRVGGDVLMIADTTGVVVDVVPIYGGG